MSRPKTPKPQYILDFEKETRLKIEELSEDALATFNIEDFILQKIFGSEEENIYEDNKNYAEYWLKDSTHLKWAQNILSAPCVLHKMAMAKALAVPLDYEIDASYFSNYIFNEIYNSQKPVNTKWDNDFIYSIDIGKLKFRNDTMNSWWTPTKAYLKKFQHLGMRSYKNKEDIDKILKIDHCPEVLVNFLNSVYTIGNFMPVAGKFNGTRYDYTWDCFDLTLMHIYKYYLDSSKFNFNCTLFEGDVLEWLDGYGSGQKGWQKFISLNFLEDFVDKNYGMPLELWYGHFDVHAAVMPQTEEEFNQFFQNSSNRILARGKRIAKAYKANEKKGQEQ